MQLLWQPLRFRQIRTSALLTWPGRTPPFYRLFLVAAQSWRWLCCKLAVLHRPPTEVFGESMMARLLQLRAAAEPEIGRGSTRTGLGRRRLRPYSQIGGLTCAKANRSRWS